jgi:glycosyltransferase involved in cell wall biosynthesis
MTTMDSRIKLLKFVALFAFGGTERQVVNLALHLNPDRFDLSFGCLRRSGQFLPPLEARGFPVHEYPMRRFLSVRGAMRELQFARHLARERVDIVHAYNFYANVFALPAARLAGVPVVMAAIRDEGAYLTERQIVAQKHACRFAHVVTCNAESIKRWLTRTGYDPAKIVVIPNGVDTARFADMRPRPAIRREFDIPDEAPVVALLARLIPKKGIDHFVEAAIELHGRWPEARFLIVGAGLPVSGGATPEEAGFVDRLKARVRLCGLERRIIFTGFRDDIPDILSTIDISVLPSLSEGLSNSVLESMAAGKATISTDVGGIAEAMQDGVSGLLIPPASVPAIVRAVERLLADRELTARLGAEARRLVFERYSIPRMVESTERLYAQLLAQRAAQPGWRHPLRQIPRVFEETGGRES